MKWNSYKSENGQLVNITSLVPEKGPHPDSKLAAWYFIKAFKHKLERNLLLARQRQRMLQVSSRWFWCIYYHVVYVKLLSSLKEILSFE